jgi:general secretion pathway protein C
MELYLKRYFWVAILASIAASTLLVARTANTFVGSALEPAPLLGLDAPRTAPVAPIISADATTLGHLFGITPPAPEPPGGPVGGTGTTPGPGVDTKICWTCDPVKSGLRLQLLATMVANPAIYSSALISDLEKQESTRFTIGDKIRDQYEVHDIIREPQRVIIVNDETHRLEYIDGTPGTGQTLADTPKLPVSPVPGPGGAEQEGIKKLSENKYEISRAKLDATLADMNSLATQARIVPSFKNGQADGFKLFSIQPGSVYSAIGVENGDVIERINGFDINSPEKALEAYSRLKDSANFDIQVERRGQPVTMSYTIQ